MSELRKTIIEKLKPFAGSTHLTVANINAVEGELESLLFPNGDGIVEIVFNSRQQKFGIQIRTKIKIATVRKVARGEGGSENATSANTGCEFSGCRTNTHRVNDDYCRRCRRAYEAMRRDAIRDSRKQNGKEE